MRRLMTPARAEALPAPARIAGIKKLCPKWRALLVLRAESQTSNYGASSREAPASAPSKGRECVRCCDRRGPAELPKSCRLGDQRAREPVIYLAASRGLQCGSQHRRRYRNESGSAAEAPPHGGDHRRNG